MMIMMIKIMKKYKKYIFTTDVVNKTFKEKFVRTKNPIQNLKPKDTKI